MLITFLVTLILAVLGVLLYDDKHQVRKFSYLLVLPFVFVVVFPVIWFVLGISLIGLIIYGVIYVVEKTLEKGGKI